MTDLVPLIDLAPWHTGDPAKRAEIAAAVDDACCRIGFLQITGHGIAPERIEAMLAAVNAFFSLPLEEKLRWNSPSPEINRGYAAKGTEGLAYSLGMEAPPDLFEAFNIGPEDADYSHPVVAAERERAFAANMWPDRPTALKPALTAYFAEARRVAHLLTEIFAQALGLSEGFFDDYTRHSTDVLRVNYYERRSQDPDPVPGQMRMGAHTDYGIVTVLYADAIQSLQVLGPHGEWYPIAARPGSLLVNLGDLLAQWTNDRWRSTLHRVVPPPTGTPGGYQRISVAFFHDGNHDALIECLPTCHDADNPPKYPAVIAGEHILAKLIAPRTLSPTTAVNTAADRIPAAD